MSTLLLRLKAPLQSWGGVARFTERHTEREPTKSGVVGLLCAALGINREEHNKTLFSQLAKMPMGVRVLASGVIIKDYQTVHNVHQVSGAIGKSNISNRYYLCDADFLVGLEGNDELLNKLGLALQNPTWFLYLGRKCCIPSLPVFAGIQQTTLRDSLVNYQDPFDGPKSKSPIHLVMESKDGILCNDVPFSLERNFSVRYVRHEYVTLPKETVNVS